MPGQQKTKQRAKKTGVPADAMRARLKKTANASKTADERRRKRMQRAKKVLIGKHRSLFESAGPERDIVTQEANPMVKRLRIRESRAQQLLAPLMRMHARAAKAKDASYEWEAPTLAQLVSNEAHGYRPIRIQAFNSKRTRPGGLAENTRRRKGPPLPHILAVLRQKQA